MRRIYLVLIAVFALVTAAQAQLHDGSKPFNGLIIREDGRGVKARVEVVGSDKLTFSDGKGRFGLTDIKPEDVLRIVFRRDEILIPVAGRSSLRIVLSEESLAYTAEESQELANIGFGYVKRREKVDFSSGISGDRLRATGCSNVIDALLMFVPSLRMVNGELCLYGQGTINSSSAVLVLCDGQEINPAHINIADVENVEVLKGANMYGFRGANGVVLITTKSAQSK